MKKLILSTIASAALVTASWAGGKLVEPPHVPPVVVDNWSGPYVGLQAGYLAGKATVTPVSGDAFTLKPNGIAGGLFAGYNWLTPSNLLFGVEADINGVSASKSKELFRRDSAYVEPISIYKFEQNWDASLRLRVGGVIEDKYLIYATGGATWAGVKASYTNALSVTTSEKKTLNGWTLGAGVEMKVTDNVNARLQYRYNSYSKKQFNLGPSSVKYKNNMIQAGVSYKFN
ncbi:MAG TPA: porin family protein [Nitratifractor sp.]|nr:porin family protein [Nitratifractor sp.]HHD74283.1 porin family protein [Nitratifractor sp.]